MEKYQRTREIEFWVRTEPTLDGSGFIVTLNIGEDYARPMTPVSAFKYARTVLTACQYAEYDAAVYTQLKSRGLDDEKIFYGVIGPMRQDRPEISDVATKPMRFQPIVSSRDPGTPRLSLWLNEENLGIWEMDQAYEHAFYVLNAVSAADLDLLYHRRLSKEIGLEDGTARNVVDDLANWRTRIEFSQRPPDHPSEKS